MSHTAKKTYSCDDPIHDIVEGEVVQLVLDVPCLEVAEPVELAKGAEEGEEGVKDGGARAAVGDRDLSSTAVSEQVAGNMRWAYLASAFSTSAMVESWRWEGRAERETGRGGTGEDGVKMGDNTYQDSNPSGSMS